MALKRRRNASHWLILTQIVLLSIMLIVILFFRDLIATGASNFVGVFGNDDIQVEAPAEPGAPSDLSSEPPADNLEMDLNIKPNADPAEDAE
ncbi:hypothetical protein [Bradymonas sediminis]|uniref:Uncharacterized protein n=1 Tax=Bradymonas sediminis TaxID=1548548 RepID=A0A2Z4FKP7_9DELT|nr:hypothetical protein [Bradymonas sediminis]AWV89551.1 hypothetical protein DN745_09470 [Bradymonas sediminis]TDP76716.1 hypothetical protein DFR33_102348 [Bradymonas sediminis]